MTEVLIVFAWLEGLLLVGAILALIWGWVHGWGLELVMPVYAAVVGTAVLAACLLIAVVVHDHVHIGVS